MLLSYNVSSQLKSLLERIENLRSNILLIPLSPEDELRLRWEAIVEKTYWSLNLNGNLITKQEIVKLLSSHTKRRLTREEDEVIRYKQALSYISRNWLVSKRSITVKTVLELHDTACYGRLRVSENSLKQILDYLQASPDHPVIQAAVAQIQIRSLSAFTEGNELVSFLLSHLFFYRGGYDFRGMLVLEEYFKRDFARYQQVQENSLENSNVTLWLEYFAQSMAHQLEKVMDDLKEKKFSTELNKSFFELNDRQKEILSILEQPDITISNQKVQRLFKISQITASRDLARLANLGLLFPRGKGRSVHYTRV